MAWTKEDYLKNLKRTRLFVLPSIFTAGVYLLWLAIHSWWPHLFPAEDSQPVADAVNKVTTWHSMLAAVVLGLAITGWFNLFKAHKRKDYVTFVELRDERIPWPVHWMLGCFSMFIIVGTLIIHYSSPISGTFDVISTTMSISLYWQTAMVADNPIASKWYEGDERITKEMREMTMEDAIKRMRTLREECDAIS